MIYFADISKSDQLHTEVTTTVRYINSIFKIFLLSSSCEELMDMDT